MITPDVRREYIRTLDKAQAYGIIFPNPEHVRLDFYLNDLYKIFYRKDEVELRDFIARFDLWMDKQINRSSAEVQKDIQEFMRDRHEQLTIDDILEDINSRLGTIQETGFEIKDMLKFGGHRIVIKGQGEPKEQVRKNKNKITDRMITDRMLRDLEVEIELEPEEPEEEEKIITPVPEPEKKEKVEEKVIETPGQPFNMKSRFFDDGLTTMDRIRLYYNSIPFKTEKRPFDVADDMGLTGTTREGVHQLFFQLYINKELCRRKEHGKFIYWAEKPLSVIEDRSPGTKTVLEYLKTVPLNKKMRCMEIINNMGIDDPTPTIITLTRKRLNRLAEKGYIKRDEKPEGMKNYNINYWVEKPIVD
jgi:predicted small metal-binding protein